MKVKTRFIILDREKNKGERCTISLRIGYNRKYAFQDTGIEILQEQFDEIEAKRGFWAVVKGHPKKDDLNLRLKALMDRVFNIHQNLVLEVNKSQLAEGILTINMVKTNTPVYSP